MIRLLKQVGNHDVAVVTVETELRLLRILAIAARAALEWDVSYDFEGYVQEAIDVIVALDEEIARQEESRT